MCGWGGQSSVWVGRDVYCVDEEGRLVCGWGGPSSVWMGRSVELGAVPKLAATVGISWKRWIILVSKLLSVC